MFSSFKTEAFVLKKKDLLNKDILISLFTKKEGKVIVIAKGVKKITSKRAPHLQTGNLINVQLNKKNNIIYLEESQLISAFSQIKNKSKKINILYQYFFVLDKLLPENQKELSVYNLTKSFLFKIHQSISEDNFLISYLNKTLKVLGYIKKDYQKIDLEVIISDLIGEKFPSFNI